MSSRRSKQPRRGARKPARKRTPKPPSELKPFKIVGHLIGARYDEHGEIVAEEPMGEVAIYRSNFGKVEQLVDQALDQARQQAESIQKEMTG